MSHYSLQANGEDVAYLNLYPVAFQARDAMSSATSLPDVVIPVKETRNLASNSGAKAHSSNAAINLLGERAGRIANRFLAGSGLLSRRFRF